MVCYRPIVCNYSLDPLTGKKDVRFSHIYGEMFRDGYLDQYVCMSGDQSILSLPCGKCMGCRLNRSREWAIRIVHEAQMHASSLFVTLTFNDKYLAKMCPTGSICKEHVQNFMKRARKFFASQGVSIRYYACGEYGEKFKRPHYHLILFGASFSDKELFKRTKGGSLYKSAQLSKLWKFGFASFGDVTFESAAYVARYCTKKVNGEPAKAHYGDRLPEFALQSTVPAIGYPWLDVYGETDCFIHDQVVLGSRKSKPPRAYDKYFEKKDPERYKLMKLARVERSKVKPEEKSYDRLKVREKVQSLKFSLMMRSFENELCV